MLQADKGISKRITKFEIKSEGIMLFSNQGTLVLRRVDDSTVQVQYWEESLHNKDERNEFVLLGEADTEAKAGAAEALEAMANDAWTGEYKDRPAMIQRVNAGENIAEALKNMGMSFHDEKEDCIIDLPKLRLRVRKDTGAITFLDADNNILLCENAKNPRESETYPIYEEDADSVKIEKIPTADGVKERIISGSKIFSHNSCRIRNNFEFDPNEDLYGLGQFEEGITSLRGQRLYLNQDNRKIIIPYMISTKGYGILFNMHSPLIFQDRPEASYIYAEAVPCLDYYFTNGGSLKEAMRAYRRLTGKAMLLPRWAFGYIQSQERYETSQEILEVSQEYRRRGLGLDTIVLDWCSWPDGLWGEKKFDKERFPAPSDLMSALHDNNIHFMISIWPNMAQGGENYREFKEKNLLLKNSDTYNAFSKEARDLYWKQANEGLFKYGIDAWWCDNSEPYDPSWFHKFRREPSALFGEYIEETSKHMDLEYANTYAYFHAKGIYEGQRESSSQKRVVNLTRSAYLGSQRFGTIMWSGDIDAKWSVLKNQIAAGIGFAFSGMPYWTVDIGAFFVKEGDTWYWRGEYEEGFDDEGYRELFTRWYWWAAFLPIFRGHGTDVRRELWLCKNGRLPYYDALVEANRLRYRFLHYIYSYAGAAYHHDGSIIYPLAALFPNDVKCRKIADQYMFGKEIMICPVYEPMAMGMETVRKSIYLPEGDAWYDFFTQQRFEGGENILYDCPINRIGIFVRNGAVLPMACLEGDTLSTENLGSELDVMVFGDGHIPFLFYDDAHDGYDFEQGHYSFTEISFEPEEGNVSFKTVEGAYKFDFKVKNLVNIS